MMLIPRDYSSDDLKAGEVSFNKNLAVITGLLVGVLLGIVGREAPSSLFRSYYMC